MEQQSTSCIHLETKGVGFLREKVGLRKSSSISQHRPRSIYHHTIGSSTLCLHLSVTTIVAHWLAISDSCVPESKLLPLQCNAGHKNHLCQRQGQYTWVLFLSCRQLSRVIPRTCSDTNFYHDAIFLNMTSRFDDTFPRIFRLHRVAHVTSSFKSWVANALLITSRCTTSFKSLSFVFIHESSTPLITIGGSSAARMILFSDLCRTIRAFLREGFVHQLGPACLVRLCGWLFLESIFIRSPT